MKLSHLSLAALLLGVMAALPVSAASLINVGSSYSNNSAAANVGVKADTNVKVIPNTSNASGNTSAKAGEAQVNANINSNTTNSNTDNQTNTLSTSGGVEVRRADVSANTNVNVVNATDVSSETDLKNYASSALQADSNIDGVTFTNDQVAVGYKDRGRWLAIFPVTISVKAAIDANGNVNLDYPWYDFLVVKNGNLSADLKARVDSMVNARLISKDSATWSNRDRALVADQLRAALKAHFSESASSSTTASTTGY